MHDLTLLVSALILDALLGDPPHWPHMVRFMGLAINKLESILRPRASTPSALRLAGAIMTLILVLGSGVLTWGIILLTGIFAPALGLLVALAFTFQSLAPGQLWREAKRVVEPLEQADLQKARQRLAMIVGRETSELSETQVRQAVIETVAENLNDGVIAPLFYFALGGPAWAVAYKAVNTLDSMVGYKNEKYKDFGWFAAKLDDLAGWAPARLSAFMVVVAARLIGLNAKGAASSIRSDHNKHKSPNAGWPESAFAGALEIRLGGPNYYHGKLVDKPWLNPQARFAGDSDFKAALRLMWGATLAMTAFCSLWLVV
ncbi:adenosylcobinamide-phosphate synthase CbiB [Dethiosulfatarculus sandiegensis]|uniref:Cobalamin biosynthesis protein CobD n=1 Tax=Dethiosulfatarculus sandiegensis TaxID=1429043 RepID=A0A0D2GEF1_9BACT|nr:adenosylcobinamide-phosphate synthase CbiB [Dethiosulfatarculus sandiegensis]KIX13367.1 cobalamin biosynthesis protein [Dethiosulfatarculus sandiegensis]